MRVRLQDLQSRPELNGQFGSLISFDHKKERWGVKLDGMHETLALKQTNVCATRSRDTCAWRRKLCRYGNCCYRPGCHYRHADESERVRVLTEHWSAAMKSLSDSGDASDADSATIVGMHSKSNDASMAIGEVESRMKELMERLEKVERVNVQDWDERLKQKLCDLNVCVGNSSTCSRKDDLLADIEELTDLNAQQFAELDNRVKSGLKHVEETLSQVNCDMRQYVSFTDVDSVVSAALANAQARPPNLLLSEEEIQSIVSSQVQRSVGPMFQEMLQQMTILQTDVSNLSSTRKQLGG